MSLLRSESSIPMMTLFGQSRFNLKVRTSKVNFPHSDTEFLKNWATVCGHEVCTLTANYVPGNMEGENGQKY